MIAEDLVRLTDRMTRLAALRSPSLRKLRNLAVAFAGHIPALKRGVARLLGFLCDGDAANERNHK